jgi:hypothetical protein
MKHESAICVNTYDGFQNTVSDCISLTDLIGLSVVLVAIYGFSAIVKDILENCCPRRAF